MQSLGTSIHTLLNQTVLSYTLIRCQRKTIGLKVDQQGLTLRVPLKCSKAAIENALLKHAHWINTKLAQQTSPRSFHTGQTISYLGQSLVLNANASISQLTEEACHLAVDNTHTAIQNELKTLFRKNALPYFKSRAAYWAEKMQLFPTKISLSSAKTRWGSCNHRGEIRFSLQLMQVSPLCIDYVIIHELAHLQEMNHSLHFWKIVAIYCPDYQKRRRELKACGQSPYF